MQVEFASHSIINHTNRTDRFIGDLHFVRPVARTTQLVSNLARISSFRKLFINQLVTSFAGNT